MATRNNSRSGGNRPRTHPTRSTKSPKKPRTASRPPTQPKPRIAPAIEVAIDDQRESLETAISLLYCLHSALRRQIEDVGKSESKAVKDASKEADLTDITEMLLVRLNSIHIALDLVNLETAKVDPERVEMAKAVCKMTADIGEGAAK